MIQDLRTEFLNHAHDAMAQRASGEYTPLAAGFHSVAGIRPLQQELVQQAPGFRLQGPEIP